MNPEIVIRNETHDDVCAISEVTMAGLVIDQAALHGILSRIRDLGVPLLSIRRLPADE